MVGHDGHRGWIYYLAAAPFARRQGIGRRLVAAAEVWIEQRGIPKAQLMVRDTNLSVIEFYEAIGWKRIPRAVLEKWL